MAYSKAKLKSNGDKAKATLSKAICETGDSLTISFDQVLVSEGWVLLHLPVSLSLSFMPVLDNGISKMLEFHSIDVADHLRRHHCKM
jgi:hypothetical protein